MVGTIPNPVLQCLSVWKSVSLTVPPQAVHRHLQCLAPFLAGWWFLARIPLSKFSGSRSDQLASSPMKLDVVTGLYGIRFTTCDQKQTSHELVITVDHLVARALYPLEI